MKINFKKALNKDDRLVLVPIFSNLKNTNSELRSWLEKRIINQEFNSKVGEHITYFSDDTRYFFWCFGELKEKSSKKIRNQFALAIKHLRQNTISELTIMLNSEFLEFSQTIGEVFALANYSIALFKTGKDKSESEDKIIKKITVASKDITRVQKYDLEEGLKIGLAVNQVRDLVNSPHNHINVDTFAEKAEQVCSANKVKIKILDRKQLEKLKMGALLGVNQGSQHGAKLVLMEYLPLGGRQEPVVLVGKGVTFDTGGVNIKPSQGITEMHMDMAGGAAVLGVFMLLKELEIKQNVVGVIPLTDNSVDATAQKPSDIVTSFSGKTIEIGNTDAEGRLILADAISYAIKEYKPSSIIDVATLTGACIVALGDQMAGMFGNNAKMKERLRNAAQETDEEVWELPIHDAHRRNIKSKFADLNNVDVSGSGGGASTGAAFIENFVEGHDWIHLDIAGPAMPKKHKDIDFAGGTGYGVRLLVEFLRSIK